MNEQEKNESLGEIKTECNIRRFILKRDEDVSGVSGTGIVAEGIEFSDGKVIIRFLSSLSTITIFDNMKGLKHTSLHKGATKVVWIDQEPFKSEEDSESEPNMVQEEDEHKHDKPLTQFRND